MPHFWERVPATHLWDLAGQILSRMPLERLLIRRNPERDLREFAERTSSLHPEAPTKAPASAPAPNPAPALMPRVTQEETVEHQHREMAKKLLLIEGHLAQGVRIAGRPCDCVSPKHSTELEALAEESVSINPSQAELYKQLADFARELNRKAREDVVESGQYDSEYPALAGRARQFRKELMGSERPSAVLTPTEKEAVKSRVSQMLESALGGQNVES